MRDLLKVNEVVLWMLLPGVKGSLRGSIAGKKGKFKLRWR